MTNNNNDNQSTLIDMNEDVRVFLLVNQTAKAIALEINTGMKMSNRWNPMTNAKSLGFKGRRKIDALKFLVEQRGANVSESIVKAFAKHGLEVVATV